VFPKKRSAPLGVTGVTVFIDTGLHELRRMRRPVWIMTVATGDLSFSQRHMGRAHELRFALEMALTTDFRLRPLAKKRGSLSNLGKLISVGGFLHQGVAIYAGYSSRGMRARFPVGLYAALMTTEAGLVLDSW
jgi:hypothetical protein